MSVAARALSNPVTVAANSESVEDEAAAPDQNQQGRFPWLIAVFAAIAAIAGVSVEEYIRRKK